VVAPVSTGYQPQLTVKSDSNVGKILVIIGLILAVFVALTVWMANIQNDYEIKRSQARQSQTASSNHTLVPPKPLNNKAQTTKKKNAVEEFSDKMNKTVGVQLFSNYEILGNSLTVTTTSAWDKQDYDLRFKMAQMFHAVWTEACALDDPAKAPFSLKDVGGNEVGGFNILNGSWVEKK
jgi:hypothetical protein